jgi:hypothetical protein
VPYSHYTREASAADGDRVGVQGIVDLDNLIAALKLSMNGDELAEATDIPAAMVCITPQQLASIIMFAEGVTSDILSDYVDDTNQLSMKITATCPAMEFLDDPKLLIDSAMQRTMTLLPGKDQLPDMSGTLSTFLDVWKDRACSANASWYCDAVVLRLRIACCYTSCEFARDTIITRECI